MAVDMTLGGMDSRELWALAAESISFYGYDTYHNCIEELRSRGPARTEDFGGTMVMERVSLALQLRNGGRWERDAYRLLAPLVGNHLRELEGEGTVPWREEGF